MSNALELPEIAPVRVDLGQRSYDIRFYNQKPEALAADIKPFCPEKALIVSNETIWKFHGEELIEALRGAGIEAEHVLIGDGEKYKSLQTASQLYDELVNRGFSRKGCIIAFGGGVIGDTAGFVAATFMRRINLVQVPTTVVAMVDSSIGGKTGVDHPLGKNLIGAFYQPKLVAVDLRYLNTLDAHNLHGGFAEVIKYGVIQDAVLFDYLDRHIEKALSLDPESLARVVRTSCDIKARVVSEDEQEGGLRAILNYGHTFAHAIESVGEYAEVQFHGQAVGIGMVAAAELACRMGLFSRAEAERQRKLIERAKLPVNLPANMRPQDVLDRMKTDKKAAGGKVRFILPRRIGEVELRDDVEPEQVLQVLQDMIA